MRMLRMTSSTTTAVLLAAGFWGGWGSSASAMEFDLQVFGHRVAVESDDDGEILKVDDREVHRNIYVHIERVAVIDDVRTIVGTSSDGGNACAPTPFVLTLPAGDEPKLEMFPEDCAGPTSSEEDGKLVFTAEPLPGRDGERWSWDPTNGFKSMGALAFKSDPGKGWNSLVSAPPEHPSGLYDFGAIADQLDELLGDDAADFKEIITGVGSGELRDDGFYVGTSCLPHSCGAVEAIVVADTTEEQVYVAWKPLDAKIIVRPEVKSWPASARTALREWAATWN
jgi:hypothetical protein